MSLSGVRRGGRGLSGVGRPGSGGCCGLNMGALGLQNSFLLVSDDMQFSPFPSLLLLPIRKGLCA